MDEKNARGPENNAPVKPASAPPAKKPAPPAPKPVAPKSAQEIAAEKAARAKKLKIILPVAAVVLVAAVVSTLLIMRGRAPKPVVVTDTNGVPVTDVNGNPVTVVPQSEAVPVTDGNGNVVTDADGNTVTRVVSKEVDVAVPVTDANGALVTDANGKNVTEKIKVRPDLTEDGAVPGGYGDGVSVVGTSVVAITDGVGHTGRDEQGNVLTTVIDITSVPAIVEPAKTEWKATQGGYDYDKYTAVVLLSDGTYAAANVSNSKDGDHAEFKDGGFSTPYTILTKFDNNGNIVWRTPLGSKRGNTEVAGLAATQDGGFYAVGYGQYPLGLDCHGYYDAFVSRVDANGKVQWTKTFGTSTVDLFEGACVTSDGGVVAVGSVGNNDYDAKEFGLPRNQSAACIVKYDANGNLVWKDVFGGNQDVLYAAAEGKDGSIYTIGTFYSSALFTNLGKSDAGVVRYSSAGKRTGVAPICGSGIESFRGLTATSDGGVVAVGRSNSSDLDNIDSFFKGELSSRGGYDAYIAKFSADLSLQWGRAFRGQNDDRFSDVAETADGDLIAVGYTNSSSRDLKGVTTRGGDDMVIASFGKSGSLKWARACGGTANDCAEAICLGADGGYVIAGYTESQSVDFENMAKYAHAGKPDAAIVKFPE
ncbi:MAG: hypothetical protein II738_07910 [Clostridia bacterium]|nr:hypothetical protein [Clostridia bacterium]